MWQKLAKTNLNGYVYDFDTKIIVKDQNTNDLNCIRFEHILLKII